jgi:hypothetical protein
MRSRDTPRTSTSGSNARTRHFRLSSAITSAAAVLTTLAATPRPAHAFAEDLCYAPGGGPVASCAPLPPICQPAGTTSDACKVAILAVFAAGRRNSDGGRSSVHTDSTYLLAQAVGFSATDAYWISAYDEATDLGSFEPRDNASAPVGGGALATASISGVVRTDGTSGGVFLHLIAPYNHGAPTPPPGVNGLHPVPTDANTEPTLANFRAWALAASSTAKPACTAGLTIQSAAGDYATGAACYVTGTPIRAPIALFGELSLPVQTAAGPQIVQDPSTGAPIFAPAFDALVATDGAHEASATHAADARLGVYLHILADRITHHVCTDRSAIAGPTAGGFRIDLTNSDCTQPLHLLRHAWETGVDFSTLLAQDHTTDAALITVYNELVAFARARGVLRAGADSDATRASYTTALAHALQQFAALDRVAAIGAIGCAHGLVPLPGQPACTAAH